MLKTIKNLIAEGIITNGALLDLGAGSGTDAKFAAEHGFEVTAVDKKPLVDPLQGVNFVLEHIENFNIAEDVYTVIYADNSLPFLSKEDAKKVLILATRNVKERGTLYFSLFGTNDAWAQKEHMNFWTKQEALQFVESLGLTLYRKIEEEGNAPRMDGEIKYWHIFRFILKKL